MADCFPLGQLEFHKRSCQKNQFFLDIFPKSVYPPTHSTKQIIYPLSSQPTHTCLYQQPNSLSLVHANTCNMNNYYLRLQDTIFIINRRTIKKWKDTYSYTYNWSSSLKNGLPPSVPASLHILLQYWADPTERSKSKCQSSSFFRFPFCLLNF